MKSLCTVLLLMLAGQPLSVFDAYASEPSAPPQPQPVYVPQAEAKEVWRTPSGRTIDEQQIQSVNSRAPFHMRIRPSDL